MSLCKKIKESLCIMLTSTMILSCMAYSTSGIVFAAENNKGYIAYNEKTYINYKDVCDKIAEGMINLDKEIYIKEYRIDDPQTIRNIFTTVLKKHPELFYISNSSYSYATDGSYIVVIRPTYLYDKETTKEKINIFNGACDSYLRKINDNMTEFEQALVLHDEIVLNCEYEDSNSLYTTAYAAIVDGNANCQGYSGAYSYLLSLAGIDSEIILSPEMSHVWNKVNIDNSYYNVDLTWNDPMPNRVGQVSHKYFLLSDNKISEENDTISAHYGSVGVLHDATNTKYDNSLIHKINTKFCFVGNDCYAFDNKYQDELKQCLFKYDTEKDTMEVIKQFYFKWQAAENRYWSCGFSSLDEKNGILYFNSPELVHCYDTVKNTFETFAKTRATKDCYGLIIKNDNVYIRLSDNPNLLGEVQFLNECKEGYFYPDTEFDLGDINRDGHISILDVTELQKYLVGIVPFASEQILLADYDGDGVLTISDATMLQKHIAGIL